MTGASVDRPGVPVMVLPTTTCVHLVPIVAAAPKAQMLWGGGMSAARFSSRWAWPAALRARENQCQDTLARCWLPLPSRGASSVHCESEALSSTIPLEVIAEYGKAATFPPGG